MNRSNELWISPVSLCVIRNGLGPGSEVGGKAKKIGERSERESLGRDKDEGARPPSPLPSPHSACLACRFFAVSSRFCLFPPLRSLVPTELMLYNGFTIKINLEVRETVNGRCSCKKTGSSHLNAVFFMVATLCRHTLNDPVVTEVTRISVQPLYFRNHTPTVLYNQKYKEYEITKNVEISTK